MSRKSFFGAMRALLPRSRAFDLTPQKALRQFFEAFSVLPDDIRGELEGVLLDYYPETTRALDKWESAFRMQLSETQFSDSERQKVITALWWLRYGDTTREFMEKVLSLFISGVHVADNTPVMDITGLTQNYKSVNGNKDMYCGGRKAVCASGTLGFVYKSVNGVVAMCCGNKEAINGYREFSGEDIPSVLANDSAKPWDIPSTLSYQSLCFFISGEITRADTGEITNIQWLSIEKKWQKIIEYIVLALKPVHTTAVLWIHYI